MSIGKRILKTQKKTNSCGRRIFGILRSIPSGLKLKQILSEALQSKKGRLPGVYYYLEYWTISMNTGVSKVNSQITLD